MLTDSHCHLSFPELREQLDDVLADMKQAQVSRALCICTTLEEFDEVHALACAHDQLWATVGVHPDNEGVREPTVEDLILLAQRPKVVAIGETGLDYFDMAGRKGGRQWADMAWQRDRFRRHIQAARAVDMPLIVHTRAASADTLSILSEEASSTRSGSLTLAPTRGVFHCFTESMQVAKAALNLGFYISFSGILTFKNAQDLRDVAAYVPLDRCLVETDSPYLAPVPHRGKLNRPSNVRWVAASLAQIKGLSLEEVARATSDNFDRLFTRLPYQGSMRPLQSLSHA